MLRADASDARSGHDHYSRCDSSACRQRVSGSMDRRRGGPDVRVRNAERPARPEICCVKRGCAPSCAPARRCGANFIGCASTTRLSPSLTLNRFAEWKACASARLTRVRAPIRGVPWAGRAYRREQWGSADPINRALSAANSCLYGICHAAIVSAGYSPALGFIHTGKMLSFVYDIADLYKSKLTIPVAFRVVAAGASTAWNRASARLPRRFSRFAPALQRIVSGYPARTRWRKSDAEPDFDADAAASD